MEPSKINRTMKKNTVLPQFTQQQSREMYAALEEIHEALMDKRETKGGMLELSPYEIGWLVGIDGLLKRIIEPLD